MIPGSGKSPGVGNGKPFQYSFLENSMDRGAWGATVYGVAEPDLTKHARMRARAHTHTHTHTHTHPHPHTHPHTPFGDHSFC